MEHIANWLEKLGLGEYAKLFADNDIDVSVLPHLTDEDLRGLGVSLGHRRKIFAAINGRFGSAQPLTEIERPEQPKAPESPERRYLTVLFSDLVGSSAPRRIEQSLIPYRSVRLQIVWDNLSCLRTEALARLG